MISHVARAGLLAIACAAALPIESAIARTPFDGEWSVLIVTQRGTCDRAYRYGVQIINGYVVYDGGFVNLSGRVWRNGSVRVSVTSGASYASGSGRLTRSTGRGNWSGHSGNDACSGYWTAERR